MLLGHPELDGRLLDFWTGEQVLGEQRHVVADGLTLELAREPDAADLATLGAQGGSGIALGPERDLFLAVEGLVAAEQVFGVLRQLGVQVSGVERRAHHHNLTTWHHHVGDGREEVVDLLLADDVRVRRLVVESVVHHDPVGVGAANLGAEAARVNAVAIRALDDRLSPLVP